MTTQRYRPCCADPLAGVALLGEWFSAVTNQAGRFWVDAAEADKPILQITQTMLPPLALQALVGYDAGSSAVAVVYSKVAGVSTIFLNTVNVAAIIGMAGGVIGVYVKGDELGPQPMLLVGCGLYGAGAVCMAWAHSLPFMFIARALMGAGTGVISVTVPWYMVDVAPASLRGSLAGLHQAFFAAGLIGGASAAALTVAVIDFHPALPYVPLKAIYSTGVIPAGSLLLAVRSLPQSFRWMMVRARIEGATDRNLWYQGFLEAQRSLVAARGIALSPSELTNEVNVVDGGVEKVLSRISEYSKVEPTGLREVTYDQLLQVPGITTALSTSAGLVVLKNLCGHSALFGLYVAQSSSITQVAGAIVLVASVKALASLGMVPFLDTRDESRGRLLFDSTVVLSASLAAAGIGLDYHIPALATAGVVLNTTAYQASYGPLRYLYPAEVFPAVVRHKGIAVMEGLDYCSGFATAILFQSVAASGGLVLAATATSIGTFGTLLTLRPYMVETSWKNLETIEDELATESSKAGPSGLRAPPGGWFQGS
jgi:MFS family permease